MLLDNCFYEFGARIYQKIIGVPMGSDLAPFMLNFFFYHNENNWFEEKKKEDLITVRNFGKVFCFIDNLTATNDDEKFEKDFPEMYPTELELITEDKSAFVISFLNLHIKIPDKIFTFF